MSKVSIIMPVYNVEKYIEKSIRSILDQTYKNIELIIIDDGSVDRSGEICNHFALKEDRIKVLHQENSGVSIARNNGLKNVTGEFLIFVDADDYLELDMVEKLYKEMKKGFDLVICGYKIHENKIGSDFTNNIIKEIKNETMIITSEEIAQNYWDYFNKGLINPLWNKMYKTSLIKEKNITFPSKINFGEDGYFNVLYLMNVTNVIIINELLYHYIRYELQSSSRYYSNYLEMMISNYKIIEKYVNLYNGFQDCNKLNNHNYEFFCVIKNSMYHIVNQNKLSFSYKIKLLKSSLNNEYISENIKNIKLNSIVDKWFLILIKLKLYYLIFTIIEVFNGMRIAKSWIK